MQPTQSTTPWRELLDDATSLSEVCDLVRRGSRGVCASDGATFVVREGDRCFYVDEDAIAPLWKGQRFKLTECISGWAMLNAATAVVPDIEKDDRIPIEAYRPTFVKSLAMAPVGGPAPVAAIGVYWARRHRATDAELTVLSALARSAAAALHRVGLDEAPWAPHFSQD